MTITVKSILSMIKSRRFREQHGLPVKTQKPPKKDAEIALRIQRDYIFPGDETDEKPPDT